MDNKVILITGATNGIGKVTAIELAKQGGTIVIVGRNLEKTTQTVKEIQQASGNNKIEYLLADLSSMAEIRRLAAEFKQKYSRLDVLVNNAGATFTSREETVDGYEKTFATNHLSYFLLTTLLLDVLKASAPSRIVSVSSDAHKVGSINFDDLQARNGYGTVGFKDYGNSKLANILFTYELARRLEGTGVTANVLHPGVVATSFGHNNSGFFRSAIKLMQRFTGLTPEQGADTIIYLASSPDVEGITGKYWEKRKAISSSKASYDEAIAKRLWTVSEELVNAVPEKV